MLRLIGLVVSIGLADSLNPTTIAPALFLALGEPDHARGRVIQFTLGVFAVYLLGGLIIALGPGELLLALIPRPDQRTRWILEVVAGVAILVGSAYLWRHRERLARRELPQPEANSKSSAILGATITAVELPTAFPYFAAIAAIVGSGFDPLRQIVLLVLFNISFVVPLLAIVATLTFAGDDAERVLATIKDKLQANWPKLLAIVGVIAGVFVTVLGLTGLASTGHGHVGRVARHVRGLFHP
jgi:cytochrome c biogenesis protein CcdA